MTQLTSSHDENGMPSSSSLLNVFKTLRVLRLHPGSCPTERIRIFPLFRSYSQLLSAEKDSESIAEPASVNQTVLVGRGNGDTNMEDYKNWSHEGLLKRVEELERELKQKNASVTQKLPCSTCPSKPEQKKTKKSPATFDPSKYSTRLIALKLSYLGRNYNGFEHHANSDTPLPTIEEELWAALMKARLIFPTVDSETWERLFSGGPRKTFNGADVVWDGCEYSKCGRTDKGVSAFGQVIGIRVRSNRPLETPKISRKSISGEEDADKGSPGSSEFGLETRALSLDNELPSIFQKEDGFSRLSNSNHESDVDYSDALDFDNIRDEIPYPAVLNRLLPPEIRILAWCPSPPIDFSARFSCRERQYRYFFTQPAYSPCPLPKTPISSQLSSPENPKSSTIKNKGIPDGWLDIEAMRTAAKYFEGTHDFRNFCKIDGSKQLTSFTRDIFKSDIEEVSASSMGSGFAFSEKFLPPSLADPDKDSESPATKVYTFTLHGSAFLWHQVRHMVAVLFLVGQGLEEPEIINTLLDIKTTPRRPKYELAVDSPLVLWNCVFPKSGNPDRKEALDWVYIGDDRLEAKYGGYGALMDDMWKVWRERKIDEVLAGSLMNVVAEQGRPLDPEREMVVRKSQRVFNGDDVARSAGASWVPVVRKERIETPEVVNDVYAKKKGFKGSAEMREALSGQRRVVGIGEAVFGE